MKKLLRDSFFVFFHLQMLWNLFMYMYKPSSSRLIFLMLSMLYWILYMNLRFNWRKKFVKYVKSRIPKLKERFVEFGDEIKKYRLQYSQLRESNVYKQIQVFNVLKTCKFVLKYTLIFMCFVLVAGWLSSYGFYNIFLESNIFVDAGALDSFLEFIVSLFNMSFALRYALLFIQFCAIDKKTNGFMRKVLPLFFKQFVFLNFVRLLSIQYEFNESLVFIGLILLALSLIINRAISNWILSQDFNLNRFDKEVVLIYENNLYLGPQIGNYVILKEKKSIYSDVRTVDGSNNGCGLIGVSYRFRLRYSPFTVTLNEMYSEVLDGSCFIHLPQIVSSKGGVSDAEEN